MKAPPCIDQLKYPVLLWRQGYSYVAGDPVELCTHPRSLYADTVARGTAGEFTLADASGAVYAVTGFEPVARFGGWKTLPHVLLRSVFAAPMLRPVTSEEFPSFRHVVAKALKGRFGKAFASRIEEASSAEEVLRLVAERDRVAG